MVAQPAGVDRRRHERVTKRVHLDERRRHGFVTEVVDVPTLGETRCGHRLDRDDAEVVRLAGELVRDEREREAAEIRAAADAAHEDIRVFVGELELLLYLLTDDRLVQQHVVEHRAERIFRVVARGCVLDGFGYREAEAAWALGVLGQRGAAGVRVGAGARDDLGAPRFHEDPPVRLLVVRHADHVDLALEVEHPRGEREGASPLSRASLGGEALGAFGLVVVGLRDRGVRLVATGGTHALPLVVDARGRPEHFLEAERADQRCRAPDLVGVPHRFGDLDPAFAADLLLDELHRKERCEVRGSDGLPRAGMERRRERHRQIGLNVVPVRRQVFLVKQELSLLRRWSFRSADSHTPTPPVVADRGPGETTPR